ncbi:MAG TPA: archease [Gemmatimonadota bacterium]|nr:archease [Gemmatimonadota bacterium]
MENQLPPGVREIEHTADLGMEVEAASLEELFQRAAAGMMALVRSTDDGPVERPADDMSLRPTVRSVRIELDGDEPDVAALLVRWLRELLYLQEVAGFVYHDATFQRLDGSGLRASVRPHPDPSRQIRELKGVTYHGLEVERDGDRWRARVIFDI